MIFWILLFLLIILVSFVLAIASMKDFAEKPIQYKSSYGLFLVKNLKALNADFLKAVYENLSAKGLIFSLEKLFKGSKAALVIFGPKDLLLGYSQMLDLLELEDYTKIDPNKLAAWEVGTFEGNLGGLPAFDNSEQFWWQLILKPQKSLLPNLGKKGTAYHQLVNLRSGDDQNQLFKCQIRAAFISDDDKRRQELSTKLQQLDGGKLKKVPIPFTSSQILKMYQDRSLVSSIPQTSLDAEKILELIFLS